MNESNALIFGIGLLLILVNIPSLISAYKTKKWRPAKGRILSFHALRKAGPEGTNITDLITTYEYSVAGKSHKGNKISYPPPLGIFSRAFPPAELEQFKAGDETCVYYNPEHPDQSVLKPGMGRAIRQFIFVGSIGVLMITIGFFLHQ